MRWAALMRMSCSSYFMYQSTLAGMRMFLQMEAALLYTPTQNWKAPKRILVSARVPFVMSHFSALLAAVVPLSLCFRWTHGHWETRRCGVWITRKNFFKILSPNLEVGASTTVVVAKGEDKYHPPLRMRREVRKWNLIRMKNIYSIPLMRSVKR